MDSAPDAGRRGGRPSLAGIAGAHHQVPTGAQAWIPRVLAALAVVQIALSLAQGNRWTALFWAFAMALYLVQARAVRRVRTVLDADGVRVHNGLTRPRLVPWAEVTGVHVQGRWEVSSRLVRRAGRDVALYGVPAAVAERLAAQLDGGDLPDLPDLLDRLEPSRPQTSIDHSALEDAGMEGSFRRGRPRT